MSRTLSKPVTSIGRSTEREPATTRTFGSDWSAARLDASASTARPGRAEKADAGQVEHEGAAAGHAVGTHLVLDLLGKHRRGQHVHLTGDMQHQPPLPYRLHRDGNAISGGLYGRRLLARFTGLPVTFAHWCLLSGFD